MAKKGFIPWNKGKRGVQTAWNKGLTKESDERVKKYTDQKRGKSLSEEHKSKISNSMIGIKRGPLSEEHKNKIRESNKGTTRPSKTEDEKRHLSNILKGRPSSIKHTYKLLIKKYPEIVEDHIIRPYLDFIEVRCTECMKWFVPSKQDMSEKIRQIKTGTGLRFLFCSEECKHKSYVYRMKKDPSLLKEYKRYCRKVEIETRKSVNIYKDKIYNYNLRGYDYHLDHRFSMLDGFNNNVLPEIVGHWKNFEILSKFENESKGGKSSITLNELRELINND